MLPRAPRLSLLVVLCLTLGSPAFAGVQCQISGQDIRVSNTLAHFDYSASGAKGLSGHMSLFRLLTIDDSDGPSSGVQLKAVDITVPGEYPVATESGWRSTVNDQGKDQAVTQGRFKFSHFAMQGSRGRAAGTVTFSTDKTSGTCSFDVPLTGMDRDRLQ